MTERTFGEMSKKELLDHFNEQARASGAKERRAFESKADAIAAIQRLANGNAASTASRRERVEALSARLKLRQGTTRQRIVDLCDGSLTRAEIAQKIGEPLTAKQVSVVLNCMSRDYETKLKTDDAGRVKIVL